MKAACCCVIVFRFPPVKATRCCVAVFAGTTGGGNVLLRRSFAYATGKGDVLLRACFAYTTGEGNVFLDPRPGLWDSLCCFSNKLFFAIVPFLVLPHLLSSLTLGGPALCLNFGPSSELGVNEGVGSLLVSFFLGFHGIFSFAPLVGSSFFPCQGCCSCRKFVKGWYSSMWYYAGALPFRWPPPFTKYGRSLPQSSFVPPLSLSDSSRVLGVLFGLRFLILATSSASSSYGLPMFFL